MKTSTFPTISRIAAAALFSIVLVASANAQSSSSGYHYNHDNGHRNCHHHRGHHGLTFYRPVYRYGYRGYDPRFGTAELLRASATANVLNSRARAINARTARVEMQNSVDFLLTRLERKSINHESRFGHLEARKEAIRAAKMKEEMLVSQQPPKSVVDLATGRVEWPMLLRSSYYAKARQPIDIVFHQRSMNGRINPDHFLPMRDWIEMIQHELKANIAHYEMQDYIEARDFLRTLLDEARVDLDQLSPVGQLAAN